MRLWRHSGGHMAPIASECPSRTSLMNQHRHAGSPCIPTPPHHPGREVNDWLCAYERFYTLRIRGRDLQFVSGRGSRAQQRGAQDAAARPAPQCGTHRTAARSAWGCGARARAPLTYASLHPLQVRVLGQGGFGQVRLAGSNQSTPLSVLALLSVHSTALQPQPHSAGATAACVHGLRQVRPHPRRTAAVDLHPLSPAPSR